MTIIIVGIYCFVFTIFKHMLHQLLSSALSARRNNIDHKPNDTKIFLKATKASVLIIIILFDSVGTVISNFVHTLFVFYLSVVL